MLHIHIIQVGKTKDEYFKEAEKEYLKRLSGYSKITVVTVNEDKKILKSIPEGSFVIALDLKGEHFCSEEFAELIEKIHHKGKVTFIIGGPYGLNDNVLEKADMKIALSRMTFTHQMVRIILLEQIYRGFTIIKGKKYHY